MKVYLFACYWPQRISVLAFGVQRMPDFVKQGLYFPRVHDGPARGLSWEWFELTGAQLSELLKRESTKVWGGFSALGGRYWGAVFLSL